MFSTALCRKYKKLLHTWHAPSSASHTETPSSRSSSPFECLRPSRLLKADRPHCSHCHRSSTAMNISGAQRHTKNVEKLLACVPSEQNRPPSHVEAEGVRKHYGKGIKASSLAAQQQAFRNESHPDKTEKCASEREGVCRESHPARRSNETNTRIRGEKNIKQNEGEGVRQLGVDVGCLPKETCRMKYVCGHACAWAFTLPH